MFLCYVAQEQKEHQKRDTKQGYLNQFATAALAQPTPFEPYQSLPMLRRPYLFAAALCKNHA